jgi:tRNA-Thr(GGU) m(6)t(6)A37 methyltransferase TsaA
MKKPNKRENVYPSEEFTFRSIGIISTPFKQKFGIPRQSLSLSKAQGVIAFSQDINPVNACRGLETFSHLWISFIFHENIHASWKDTVRPPRLGGNEKVGVFASRSTFRPNPLGLSVVKNLGLNTQNELIVQGVDMLDQTPIVDIKPYIHYADSVVNASSGFAQLAPDKQMSVEYSSIARSKLKEIVQQHAEFEDLLINVLEQDPRPAYKSSRRDDKIYSVLLYQYDVKWKVCDNTNYIIDIEKQIPCAPKIVK